jgi:hypothetical protein
VTFGAPARFEMVDAVKQDKAHGQHPAW